MPDAGDAPLDGVVLAERYDVVRGLGRGGFARTVLAIDRMDGRSVAIKLLDPARANGWKAFELFERETDVLRNLRHDGIPAFIASMKTVLHGRTTAALVMEYVAGESLQQGIDAGVRRSPPEVRRLLLDLLDVLEYLHGRVPPVLHRDITPSNVIVRSSGTPVLVDFGSVTATMLGDADGSTVAGTYGYMPYEQYMGQANPSSDLFALAATLLHAITGRAPREYLDGSGQIAMPQLPQLDGALPQVLARMLAHAPSERFADVAAVRAALTNPAPVPIVRPRAAIATRPAAVDDVSVGAWDLMESGSKPGQRRGVLDYITVAFFSVITVGVLPLVFMGMARARRRRLEPFVRDGVPASATVMASRLEGTAFGANIAHVTYRFVVDGVEYRDTDTALPTIADRWRPGDAIDILYLPAHNHDSVIVSMR